MIKIMELSERQEPIKFKEKILLCKVKGVPTHYFYLIQANPYKFADLYCDPGSRTFYMISLEDIIEILESEGMNKEIDYINDFLDNEKWRDYEHYTDSERDEQFNYLVSCAREDDLLGLIDQYKKEFNEIKKQFTKISNKTLRNIYNSFNDMLSPDESEAVAKEMERLGIRNKFHAMSPYIYKEVNIKDKTLEVLMNLPDPLDSLFDDSKYVRDLIINMMSEISLPDGIHFDTKFGNLEGSINASNHLIELFDKLYKYYDITEEKRKDSNSDSYYQYSTNHEKYVNIVRGIPRKLINSLK